MLHTTFARAKEARACVESYKKFLKHKGGLTKWGVDTPFGLDEVMEVCGLGNALWCLQIVIEPADREIRLFACDCAERVLPLFESKCLNDNRPRLAIETARRFANGQSTSEEREAAGAAAEAARAAAWAAAWAAGAATGAAAWAAAEAAGAAARAAAWAAAEAAGATARAAAETKWQKEKFLEMLSKS